MACHSKRNMVSHDSLKDQNHGLEYQEHVDLGQPSPCLLYCILSGPLFLGFHLKGEPTCRLATCGFSKWPAPPLGVWTEFQQD